MKFLSSTIIFLSAQPTMVFGSSSIHGGGGVSKEQQHESEEKATFGRGVKPNSRELKQNESQSFLVGISSETGVSSVESLIQDKSDAPGKRGQNNGKGGTSINLKHGLQSFTHSQTTKVNGISSPAAIGYIVLEIQSGDNLKDTIEELKALNGVLTVEVDADQEVFRNVRGTSPQEQVHDTMEILKKGGEHLQQRRSLAEETPYGIGMVNVTGLWNIAPQQHVKICVVDTGYGLGHVDLPNLPKVTGYSAYAEQDASQKWDVDGHGHGSHCAGTIGAIGSNNAGVVGVIPDFGDNFSFHIGKGLTNSGSGSTSGVMLAVQSCVDAGAKVISMSLGGGGYNSVSAQQFQDHYDNGVFIIAAAGNGGNSGLSYPASYVNVMSVAAVDSNKNKASFSQYNDQVEIAAPGVNVKSTLPGDNYASWSGTSMACPHVAGVAALLMSHFPNCEVNQIRNAMIISAGVDQYTNWYDNDYGWGIVNAGAAYDLLLTGCEEAGGKSPSDMNLLPHEMGVGGKDQKTLGCINDGQCQGMGGFICDTGNNICVSGPTPAPTPCVGTSVDLVLLTDNYGSETAWTLTMPNDADAVGGGYDSNSESTETFCLDDGLHTFTITDTYGDGICCDYGQGSYNFTAGGVELISGGAFTDVETKTFTISSATSPTSPPVLPPTSPPVLPPTSPPVLPPTSPPVLPPTSPPVLPPTPGPTALPPTAPTPTDYENGFAAGRIEGYDEGFLAGRYAVGYDEGYAAGYTAVAIENETNA